MSQQCDERNKKLFITWDNSASTCSSYLHKVYVEFDAILCLRKQIDTPTCK